MTKEELIEKYREHMPKSNWTDVKDIYLKPVDDIDILWIYGNNGRFYIFNAGYGRLPWFITMYPYDIFGNKIWHGYGKGWRDSDESNDK
jgi:hypothetical protein